MKLKTGEHQEYREQRNSAMGDTKFRALAMRYSGVSTRSGLEQCEQGERAPEFAIEMEDRMQDIVPDGGQAYGGHGRVARKRTQKGPERVRAAIEA